MIAPTTDQYAPYFQNYINLVPSFTNFSEALFLNTKQVIAFASQIPEAKENYAYAENKWTIKQVFQHINDTERVMCFRALVSGRGDSKVELCGMDENLYADSAQVNHKSLQEILEEFKILRAATTHLYQSFTNEQLTLKTSTQAKFPITATALAYIIIGHPNHHLNILSQRYL